MNDFDALARLIQAIDPWRTHLTLVGGWAHRLYRNHPLATVPDYDPLQTRDTDLAFGVDTPLVGDIRGALAAAGFEEQLTGDNHPPVTHYILGDDDAGFYAEFLTPLRGSGVKRNGEPDVTEARAGITAQKLRHLEILLVAPWTIRLGAEQGAPLPRPMDVLVANPVSFIVQKLLIQKHRSPAKRAHDVLYIHDTIELLGKGLGTMAGIWATSVKPTLPARTVREVNAISEDMFGAVSDTIRDAARLQPDRTLDPERIRASCRLAMSEILR